MIFEGFCSGSFESYQLYLSLWLINYCKIEIGKAFCYQLYSGPTSLRYAHQHPGAFLFSDDLKQVFGPAVRLSTER